MNRLFDPDQVPPGAETDLLLLHHVFDWHAGIKAFGQADYVVPVDGGVRDEPLLWPVSSDWAYACRAIALLVARGFRVDVLPEAMPAGCVVTIVGPTGTVSARAETQALAFARAALKGVIACIIVKN